MEKSKAKYQGIIPAFYACYDKEGRVSAEKVEELTAHLVEKGVKGQALCDVMEKAQKAREQGAQALVVRMNKNKKFQKEQLTAEGYEEFVEIYREALKQ